MYHRTLPLVLCLSLTACGFFDPPPSARIEGAVNGQLGQGPSDPLVVIFSESIQKSTLRLKVVKDAQDGEGNLLDEQEPPQVEAFQESLSLAYAGDHPQDQAVSFGASFEFSEQSSRPHLTITPDSSFSLTSYLLLVEAGLKDLAGNETGVRQRVPFGYVLKVGGTTRLPSGYYYFIFNIEFLSTQLQLFAHLDVTSDTGAWKGVFVDANRKPELNTRPGCPDCADMVCALLPTPSCRTPSEKQSTLDEFSDWLPDPSPPTGFRFDTDGFARDAEDGSIALATPPFDINLTIGSGEVKVRTQNTIVGGEFKELDEAGRFLASGSVGIEDVLVNEVSQGPTQGTFLAMNLFTSEVESIESFGTRIPVQ